MANDQRNPNGNQDQQSSGMGNNSEMDSQQDMGSGGMQRGSEGLGGQSQGTSSNLGGLGSEMDLNDDDIQLDSGDAGRGSSSRSDNEEGV